MRYKLHKWWVAVLHPISKFEKLDRREATQTHATAAAMPTMYDVPFHMREPEVCRVHGLSSAAGQLLNGLSGKVLSVHDPRDKPADERVPVKLDGIPDIKSLRRSNLDIAPARDMQIGVGVGREELQGFGTDPTQPTLDPAGLWVGATDKKSGQRWLSEDVCGYTSRISSSAPLDMPAHEH